MENFIVQDLQDYGVFDMDILVFGYIDVECNYEFVKVVKIYGVWWIIVWFEDCNVFNEYEDEF